MAAAKADGGSWTTQVSAKGSFERKDRDFLSRVGEGTDFPVESGRYHLVVSLACPWASRCLIVRKLKGLRDAIPVSVVHPILEKERSWSFEKEELDKAHPLVKVSREAGQVEELDEELREVKNNLPSEFGSIMRLKDLYLKVSPGYSNSYTVPILFDGKTGQIVNNESAEIIKILNSDFNSIAGNPDLDLQPADLDAAIEKINPLTYKINNGVYRTGFAQTQQAHFEASEELYAALDAVEEVLSKSRYLVSNDKVTLADVRFITTLVRYDMVYLVHFKCSRASLAAGWPSIWRYARDLMTNTPEIWGTFDAFTTKNHYYQSHTSCNPFGLVPSGPKLDFNLPAEEAFKESA